MKLVLVFVSLISFGMAEEVIDGGGGGNEVLEESEPQTNSECHLRPVVHILQHPGCIPKPIPSFACFGTCSSYVQVRDLIDDPLTNHKILVLLFLLSTGFQLEILASRTVV